MLCMTSRSFVPLMMAGFLAVALGCATTGKQHGKSPSNSDEASEDQASSKDGEAFEEDADSEGEGQVEPLADDSGGPPEKRTLAVVAKIVKKNRQMVRDCYNEARKKDPTLKGNLTIHFVLSPDGDVMSAELNEERSEIKTPAVADCAIMLIKALKFPPSSRGMETVVNYPFNLQPG